MSATFDVLGLGISAVDDLLYVPAYPQPNAKVPIARSARHAGGLACTAMAAVGGLGGRARYVARLGGDDLSAFIKTSLAGKNVDVSAIVHDAKAQPYHAVIIVDESGGRTVFYDCSRFRTVTAADVSEELITSSAVLFLDYLTDPPMTDIAEKVRKLGVPILADIEGRSETCRPLLPLVDYLIVSEEFARWAAGTQDLRAACAELARMPRAATVVTAGAHGCYVATGPRESPQHVSAFAVQATDTNGCGDTFHGAFALAIARRFSVRDAAQFASAAGALKAGGKGGWSSLPTASELLTFLRQRLPTADTNQSLLRAVADLL